MVFRNPREDKVLIKRLVGLPGDKVKVYRGRLFINDVIIKRDPIDDYLYREHKKSRNGLRPVTGVDVYSEQFMGEKTHHQIYEVTDSGQLDDTEEFIVPAGNVFFMGDNRDRSGDSRTFQVGYVPLTHLIGRAEYMMFSFKRCAKENVNGFELRCPERRRFMKKL